MNEPEVVDCTLVLYRSGYQELQQHWLSQTEIDDPQPVWRIVEIVPGD